MDIYYLNDCGIIRKAILRDQLSDVLVFTKEDGPRLSSYTYGYVYKLINTYTGQVLKKWKNGEDNLNIDDVLLKSKQKKLEQEESWYMECNRVYCEMMHKLFSQKLEEYIKRQWELNEQYNPMF